MKENRCYTAVVRIFKCYEDTLCSEEPKCKHYTDSSGSMGACDYRSDDNANCLCEKARKEAIEKEKKNKLLCNQEKP